MRGSPVARPVVDALAGPGSALHTLSQGAAKPGSGPLDHWAAVMRFAVSDKATFALPAAVPFIAESLQRGVVPCRRQGTGFGCGLFFSIVGVGAVIGFYRCIPLRGHQYQQSPRREAQWVNKMISSRTGFVQAISATPLLWAIAGEVSGLPRDELTRLLCLTS